MLLGIIAPVKFLVDYCVLSDVQHCYSTLFLNCSKYRDFYKNRKSEGDTIILEYSPDIPRGTLEMGKLERVAQELVPNYVVIPSVDYALRPSFELAKYFSDNWNSKSKLIGLLQGTTMEELKLSYSGIKDLVNVIGLASPLELIRKREWIIKELRIKDPVYYLEVHADPIEEVPVDENVIGISTSMPVRLGLLERGLSEFRPMPPLLDFRCGETSDMVLDNLTQFMGILNE